mmetsp:Transcript_6498/g.17709  ORF Transcript_6498/g.17709 Transcript_6498/m.17709 type:complete len:515 (-) Transcript_6498:96-1640(-)
MTRRSAQLVLCLCGPALLTAAAQAGEADVDDLEWLAVDTSAMQVGAAGSASNLLDAAAVSHSSLLLDTAAAAHSSVLLDTASAAMDMGTASASRGRRQKRKSPRVRSRGKARHSASVWPHSDDHPWRWGEFNSNACPDPSELGLTADECRSITAYHYEPRRLGDPWLVDSPLLPKGCSEAADETIYFNAHSVGGASTNNRPICREDGYTIFAGGCPTGFMDLDDVECNVASQTFSWPWDAANPLYDASLTKGCYSKDGHLYYNDHETGTPGDNNSFSICQYTHLEKRVAAAAAAGDEDAAAAAAAAMEAEIQTAAAAAAAPAPMTIHTAAAAAAAPAPMTGAASAVPAQSTSASAVGDPHMTSITGAKFDITRSGNHTLFHIPRFSAHEAALLDVNAFVKREGLACADMYINALHITGKWADDVQPGGFSFTADHRSHVSGRWMPFGKLELKVVHGKTNRGVKYLNLLAKHLSKVGAPIGGILGLDDHTEAATSDVHCKRTLSLLSLGASRRSL